MEVSRLICEERKRRGMTQAELSGKIHVSRPTISKRENGGSVSHSLLLKIIEVLKSPRLRLEVMGGALPCYYLDRVDLSPLATQQKAIEEMEEALEQLKSLNLINKSGPEDLTEEEKDKLLCETMLELQDVNICMDLILTSLSEQFEISLEDLEELSRRKMEESGYRSRFTGHKKKMAM